MGGMDVVLAVKMYITKMIEESGPGMKILLMDQETTSIVSMVYAKSEILQKEVYLLERLDSEGAGRGEAIPHLKCLAFLRPTRANVQVLVSELRRPRFGSYYIYWSNAISMTEVKMLAEADEQDVVREVQEFYADFLAVGPQLFSLGLVGCSRGSNWDPAALQRCQQGVLALLLALKKKPLVRYQADSPMAKRLAENVQQWIQKESGLFEWRGSGSGSGPAPALLVVDRRGDCVTPLLLQWTYQAMVHELLGIQNDRVRLPTSSSGEGQEMVLSAQHDEFYASTMEHNFGEMGQTMKALMEEFQTRARSQQDRLESIADMKAFVENYPEFRKLSGAAWKHVSLMGELSRMVAEERLLEVSELEQELACRMDHSRALNRIRKLLALPPNQLHHNHALRLVLLYALRHRNRPDNDVAGLTDCLKKRDVPEQSLKIVRALLEYSGSVSDRTQRTEKDQFGTQEAVKITRRFFEGLKGVENVFAQHSPPLKQTVEDLLRGRLKESAFPFVTSSFISGNLGEEPGPRDVIVFVVGGATLEESLALKKLQKSFPGAHVILGGSNLHNSRSFLQEVEVAMQGSLLANLPLRKHRHDY